MVSLGLTACSVFTGVDRHVSSTRMALIGAPADSAVFLTWSPLQTALSYRVEWRPSGAQGWNFMTVDVENHALIPGLINGLAYEAMVEAETSDGRVRSLTVQVTPTERSACAYRSTWPFQSFFCGQADADAWMRERGVRPEHLRCRNAPVQRWGPNAPDCLYTADPGFRMLLLRNVDRHFQHPVDRPSPSETRHALRNAVWRAGDPFRRRESSDVPPSVLRDAIVGSVTRYERAETLVFATNELFSGRVTRFMPSHSAEGRYAIYHGGHGGKAVETGASSIDWLLERGWEVYAMDMPMFGVNAADIRPEFPNTHFDMWKLDDGLTSPIANFMLPVKNVVDFIERRSTGSPTILMLGLSGGGWTTYTYAALDPRITAAVSIAGGRPMSQRLDAPWGALELGDYEQFAPEIYSAIRHEDLMIAAGARGSMHVFNAKDPCCFRVSPGDPFLTYLVSGAPAGNDRRIRVFVDTENAEHSIGSAGYRAVEAFLEDVVPFGLQRRPTFGPER